MNKKEKMIWKDKKTNELILISLILISLLILISIFFIINSLIERILFVIFFGFIVLYSFYVQLTRKLAILYSSGLLVGNITSKRWHKTGLRKRFFLKWNEIEYLALKGHEVKVPRGSWERIFVIIKTKYGRKYECIVYDPEGFVNALKQINKYNLLAKDSRYK